MVAWGVAGSGGLIKPSTRMQLAGGVRKIFATGYAFAAVKDNDGGVCQFGVDPTGSDL